MPLIWSVYLRFYVQSNSCLKCGYITCTCLVFNNTIIHHTIFHHTVFYETIFHNTAFHYVTIWNITVSSSTWSSTGLSLTWTLLISCHILNTSHTKNRRVKIFYIIITCTNSAGVYNNPSPKFQKNIHSTYKWDQTRHQGCQGRHYVCALNN